MESRTSRCSRPGRHYGLSRFRPPPPARLLSVAFGSVAERLRQRPAVQAAGPPRSAVEARPAVQAVDAPRIVPEDARRCRCLSARPMPNQALQQTAGASVVVSYSKLPYAPAAAELGRSAAGEHGMFATLCGSDTGTRSHLEVMEHLRGLAVGRGFVPPEEELPVRADQGSLRGWSITQLGPQSRRADFVLAVTAPRMPGMSPVHPVALDIDGPLFAVVVLDSGMVVSRADRGDVAGAADLAAVAVSFSEFLAGLRTAR